MNMKVGKKKLALTIIALLLLAKLIITFVALPEISVDYVAKYNELTKPSDYIHEDNAADDYLKACELYIEPSEELYESRLMVKWYEARTPFFTDIDPNALNLLRAWIESNKPAIHQIKSANQKPYCWFERKSEKGSAIGITFPEFSGIREISEVLINSARLNTLDNNFRDAIDDILICYCIGQRRCRENLSLTEQLSAIRIKSDAIKTALELLYYSNPTVEELRYFQESLQSLVVDEDYIPGVEAEKLFLYDYVQRVYLDWIRGINRPSIRVLSSIKCMCGDHMIPLINGFAGPSRQEVLREIDHFIDLNSQLRERTPWEIDHQCKNVLMEIEAINECDFFMDFFAHPFIGLFSLSQKEKAQTNALITVLAILRYKADHGHLPETLEELVIKGYIGFLPKDPYRDGDLSYRVINDDFVLYSYGEDYEDNNGEPITTEKDIDDRMFGASLPSSSVTKIKVTAYKDGIYWPVTTIPVCFDTQKIY